MFSGKGHRPVSPPNIWPRMEMLLVSEKDETDRWVEWFPNRKHEHTEHSSGDEGWTSLLEIWGYHSKDKRCACFSKQLALILVQRVDKGLCANAKCKRDREMLWKKSQRFPVRKWNCKQDAKNKHHVCLPVCCRLCEDQLTHDLWTGDAPPEKSCSVCGQTCDKMQTCDFCNLPWYCGQVCQQLAWKHGHRTICELITGKTAVDTKGRDVIPMTEASQKDYEATKHRPHWQKEIQEFDDVRDYFGATWIPWFREQKLCHSAMDYPCGTVSVVVCGKKVFLRDVVVVSITPQWSEKRYKFIVKLHFLSYNNDVLAELETQNIDKLREALLKCKRE